MKWVLLMLSFLVVYSFVSGNTGGASKLGENYHKLMSKTQK
ncbi:hypothetical protein [Poseidonibacter lekithochrous]|nr:hypothetical protein [Poseidonibacter lekithochrous]